MKKDTFYGTSQLSSVSYLEFGSIDLTAGKKNIWDFRLHDKAYDWLMLARYSNDMIAYMKMGEELEANNLNKAFQIYNTEMHHKDDASINLAKLIALSVSKESNASSSFFEIGQTVYGCIEGMSFYNELLKMLNVTAENCNLKEVIWYGVDISDFFNRLAKIMHSNYTIRTMPDIKQMKHSVDIFFAKGVTLLYACDSIAQFFNILDKGKLGIFDYSFSLENDQVASIGTGKQVKYLSFSEFYAEMNRRGNKMFIKRGNSKIDNLTNRVWVDCVYGNDEMCKKYIDSDVRIRKSVYNKLSSEEGSQRFLNNDINPEWIPIQNFVK